METRSHFLGTNKILYLASKSKSIHKDQLEPEILNYMAITANGNSVEHAECLLHRVITHTVMMYYRSLDLLGLMTES